ncbi:ATP-grasp domain-containing protein [Actinokineospora enzanensis]|uniref:ATP-grasp domain-containing protein n=1 Tax=Actinokineospora enzanensis TaxID=155975 RepID=UPI00036D495D|nr:ATP-grasp domain-containing protein [Actinokineospora enzanensis]
MSVVLLHTTNPSRRPHVTRVRDYCRAHGERLLIVMKDPTWEVDFADRVVSADTTSIEQTLTAVRALAAQEREPVRGVLTFVEQSVPAAAAVAAELGLPCVDERAAYLARDKFAMRSAFAAVGLDQPRFELAASLAQAREVATRVGYPLILKPLIGAGSKYVRRVDGDAELAEHFDAIRRGAWDGFSHDPLYERTAERYDRAILLEEYIPGSEISVESVVRAGRTEVLAVHDKPLPMEGPFFYEVYFSTPSRLPAELVRRIGEATAAANSALGIGIGATHTEFRVTAAGRAVILETAARLGGAAVYQSVLRSTGVDMVTVLLDLATGRDTDLTVRDSPTPTGFYRIYAERAGELARFHGVERYEQDPRVSEIALYHGVGDRILIAPQLSGAHGHVVFSAAGMDDLDEVCAELRREIRVEVR